MQHSTNTSISTASPQGQLNVSQPGLLIQNTPVVKPIAQPGLNSGYGMNEPLRPKTNPRIKSGLKQFKDGNPPVPASSQNISQSIQDYHTPIVANKTKTIRGQSNNQSHSSSQQQSSNQSQRWQQMSPSLYVSPGFNQKIPHQQNQSSSGKSPESVAQKAPIQGSQMQNKILLIDRLGEQSIFAAPKPTQGGQSQSEANQKFFVSDLTLKHLNSRTSDDAQNQFSSPEQPQYYLDSPAEISSNLPQNRNTSSRKSADEGSGTNLANHQTYQYFPKPHQNDNMWQKPKEMGSSIFQGVNQSFKEIASNRKAPLQEPDLITANPQSKINTLSVNQKSQAKHVYSHLNVQQTFPAYQQLNSQERVFVPSEPSPQQLQSRKHPHASPIPSQSKTMFQSKQTSLQVTEQQVKQRRQNNLFSPIQQQIQQNELQNGQQNFYQGSSQKKEKVGPTVQFNTQANLIGQQQSFPIPTPPPGMITQNTVHQYKRKMKKSNVVVIMNITQELYTGLLVEVTSMKPSLSVIYSGFSGDEGQAKFTMESTEDAQRLLKQFEGRRIEGSDKQMEVYFEVQQDQIKGRQKQLNSGSPMHGPSASTSRDNSHFEEVSGAHSLPFFNNNDLSRTYAQPSLTPNGQSRLAPQMFTAQSYPQQPMSYTPMPYFYNANQHPKMADYNMFASMNQQNQIQAAYMWQQIMMQQNGGQMFYPPMFNQQMTQRGDHMQDQTPIPHPQMSFNNNSQPQQQLNMQKQSATQQQTKISHHSQNCSKQHQSLSDGSSHSCACTLHQISSGSLFQLHGTPTTGSRKQNFPFEQLHPHQTYQGSEILSQQSSDQNQNWLHQMQFENGLSKTMSHPSTIGFGNQQRTLSQLLNTGVASQALHGLIPPQQSVQNVNQQFANPQELGNSGSSHSSYQFYNSSNPNAPSVNRTSLHGSSTSGCDLQNQMPLIDDESIQRVVTGEEQRTYVMMRNIPNQYTKEKLQSEINETHEGTYELLYLPIDGTSKLNKGYGFMDFLHPLFLVDFYQTYNGCSWKQAAKSTKKIQFSYGKRDKPRQLTPVERRKSQELNNIISKYDLKITLDDFRAIRHSRINDEQNFFDLGQEHYQNQFARSQYVNLNQTLTYSASNSFISNGSGGVLGTFDSSNACKQKSSRRKNKNRVNMRIEEDAKETEEER